MGSVLKDMVFQFTPTVYHVWSAHITSTTGSSILLWLTYHQLVTIIVFRISATSGSMVGYVTVSQLMATYSLVKLYLATTIDNRYLIILSTLYSIWNLDFFRSIYPPFCIHPHMSALQVASLDYIIAVYPMIMILLTYGIVILHDRFNLVIWLCRPLYTCLHRFRKEWDIKSSLIGAFATMLLLSHVKILNVSSNILIPLYSFYMNGSHSKFYVSIDIDTPYLSKTHLPYSTCNELCL